MLKVFIFSFFGSFLASFLLLPSLIKALEKKKIMGVDFNKPNAPYVPEMGGIAIVFGVGLVLVIFIALKTFLNFFQFLNLEKLLASFLVLLAIGFIGLLDDLLELSQKTKIILALIAGLPLGILKIGASQMKFPFIGIVDFKIFYPLILVPVGISGAANAFDMLAGFNGLESGLAFIISIFLALIAFKIKAFSSLILLLSLAGASLALYWFNRYPSKIFVGDIGTMSSGALIATAVILGNFELAGIILFLPHFLDCFIKLKFGLPKTFGIFKEGKLYPPNNQIKGLGHLIMKISKGISEKNLVKVIFLMEIFCGILMLLIFL